MRATSRSSLWRRSKGDRPASDEEYEAAEQAGVTDEEPAVAEPPADEAAGEEPAGEEEREAAEQAGATEEAKES